MRTSVTDRGRSSRYLLVWTAVLALLAALLLPSTASAQTPSFSDVDDDNVHHQAIEELAAMGVVQGYPDNTFRPGATITRGQLAAMVARVLDLDPVVPAGFSDTAGTTHEGAIGALAEADIISGYPDGTFRPGAQVRRDHTASIIARWLGLSPAATGPFSDVGGVHGGAIHVLERVGVVHGTTATTFAPLTPVTRAQTASLVHRSLDVAELDQVRLLATNDFHGRIEAAPYLAAHLDAIRDAHPNTIYVDAGDLVGASPVLSNLFYDEPTVEIMNAMDLTVQTVGNHEFDRGRDEILRRAAGGCLDDNCDYRGGDEFAGQEFTTLSTNVIDEATGEPLTEPREIVTVGEFDIGFVGVTTLDTPTVVSPDGVAGLEFVPEAEAINEQIPLLEAEGADIVVALIHEGGRQAGDANACDDFSGAVASVIDDLDDAVDVAITAHTHQTYVCDLADGPLVTSAGQYAETFTEITLLLDEAGEIVHRMADNRPVTDTITPDPEITAIVEHYRELAGPSLEEVVGVSEVAIPRTTREAESAQGNLATDALRAQFDDIDFAFQNSGGLRADLTNPANTDADGNFEIQRQDVLAVWPFGNTVWIAEVTGPRLQEILDNGVREIGGGRFIQLSGMRITYSIDESVDPADNNGFPRGVIESVEYWQHPDHEDGTPVDLSAGATYRIALNDFMGLGGDGYPALSDAEIVLRGDAIELVIERYLQSVDTVAPEVEGRITEAT